MSDFVVGDETPKKSPKQSVHPESTWKVSVQGHTDAHSASSLLIMRPIIRNLLPRFLLVFKLNTT